MRYAAQMMRTMRTMRMKLLLGVLAFVVGCPPATTTENPVSSKKTQLTVAGVDFAVELPEDTLGPWALLEGAGKPDGAFGRTTPAGTHATSLAMLASGSCDAALAGAKQSASAAGKTLNAADRPQWLPSRYWPVGLEAMDDATAVWIACLDTRRGPLGVTTTVTAAQGAPHAASAPHVKTALDSVATAALAAAANAPTYKVGDLVDVEWRGTWYVAKVIALEGANYRVHYEGWGSEWDESVPTSRMRAPTGTANAAGGGGGGVPVPG